MNASQATVSLDDAYAYLVDWITGVISGRRQGVNGGDIYLGAVCSHYLQDRSIRDDYGTAKKKIGPAFLSAVWELCLKGILRPGETNEVEAVGNSLPVGILFSITERGKDWLSQSDSANPFAMANSAMLGVINKLHSRFGLAFTERAAEAAACLESGTYLAACTICGATVESILLTTAMAIHDDETYILTKYRQSKGRDELKKIIVRGNNVLGNHLEPVFSILAFWRDTASHGEKANLGRYEALSALYILMSVAQFMDSRWTSITGEAAG